MGDLEWIKDVGIREPLTKENAEGRPSCYDIP